MKADKPGGGALGTGGLEICAARGYNLPASSTKLTSFAAASWEITVADRLLVTFDGPDVDETGALLDSVLDGLTGVRNSLRLMVSHLGDRTARPGQRPRWVRDQTRFRLVSTRPGSLVAELALQPPSNGQTYLENFGEAAIDAFLNWDGSAGSSLPDSVISSLRNTADSLPPETRLWIGEEGANRKVEIHREDRPPPSAPAVEPALIHGWLKEVNWDRHTAQLHRSLGRYVALRFPELLDEDMVRLANQYVTVTGSGSFNDDGAWRSMQVEQINAVRSHAEPFDLESFLSDPNPKIFRSSDVVTASEPFDVDEFTRIIREGRDA